MPKRQSKSLQLMLVLALAALSGCKQSSPTQADGIAVPDAADAQAASKQLVERILTDYAAAGETDPIGFLARRDDVDSVVVSTLQHSMSLDPRDPIRCDAKSVREFHVEKATSVSPARWDISVTTAGNKRDSFTVEFGRGSKWRLVDINCP